METLVIELIINASILVKITILEDAVTLKNATFLRKEKISMSIEDQIEMCWDEHDRVASGDGQENLLRVVSGDVPIKPDNKKQPRTKRSYKKGQRRRSFQVQSPQPAA